MDNETVLRIYYEDYVGKHMGCPALKKKYGIDFNEPFARLGTITNLEMGWHKDE